MNTLKTLLAILFFIFIMVTLISAIHTDIKTRIIHGEKICYKGHYITVHHDGWMQLLPIGEVMVPFFHEGYDEEQWICEQHSLEKG